MEFFFFYLLTPVCHLLETPNFHYTNISVHCLQIHEEAFGGRKIPASSKVDHIYLLLLCIIKIN